MISTLQDFFQRYYVILLTGFFILSGGYLLVTEFWYFGTAQFFMSEKNTILKIEKSGEIICPEKQCLIELIPGKYRYSVEKENFETVFGEMEISMQEISEQKILLKRKSTQLKVSSENFQKKTFIQSFSQENSENLEYGFQIQENFLTYNNTKILSLSEKNYQKIRVSSDEVGRGYWILTPKKIQLFSPQTQNISTHVKKQNSEISEFLSLQDGSFLTKISEDNTSVFWKPFQKPEQKLSFSPLSIGSICKSGENFIFLKKNNSGEIEAKKYETRNKKITSWGILENFPVLDFHSMQCFGNEKTVIFFHTAKDIILERG